MIITESFILTVIGLVGGGLSALLVYFLKSRCTDISCCCISCKRDVLPDVQPTLNDTRV